MVTANVDLELRQQLKEAGKQLSNPPAPVDELLHLLDQTERLLGMVDQSPNKLMQEALNAPIKALVDDSLLKHPNMDVKVSVANCICEITRITAPEAPYSDEEMKGFFQLVVSSFENLWDDASRSYSKRLSILDTVYKVRSCVIMLDLECDDLVVKMFEHFLKSVRDHHHDKGFLLMKNIMALVIEESEDISLDLLKPLLASIKINSEGVLLVARKLGEEVIMNSADKLRRYLKQAVKLLNDSLDNYSQVLTSVCEGTIDAIEHNDESPLVLHKTDETKLAPASDDAVQVMSNGKMGHVNEVGSDDKQSKKSEAIDHPDSNQTSSVVEKAAMTESKPDPTSNQKGNKSAEPTDSSDRNDVQSEAVDLPLQSGSPLKETEIVNAGPVSQGMSIIIKKGIRSKKKSSVQTAAPSMDVVLTKAPEGMSDAEMKSPKRARKKTPKAEDNKPSVTSGSDVELVEKVPEGMSDAEMISPKRARKKTLKAEVNKPSVTSGSDVEPSEKVPEGMSDVEMISPKRARKKTPKAEETKKISSKKVNAVDSESKQGKRSGKKVGGTNAVATSGSDDELLKKSSKKVDTVDSGSKPVKSLGKEVGGTDLVATSDSDMELVRNSTKKVDTVGSGSKAVKSPDKKVGMKRSVSKRGKAYDKKTDGGESDSKKSKVGDKKVDAGESDVEPLKQSGKKVVEIDSEDKTLKQSGKKGEKSKVLVKPSEDTANEDEDTDSEATPIKVSENVDEQSDSDNKPLKLSAKKGNKNSSSVVKSSSKKKPVVKSSSNKKGGKSVEEKTQAKSVSDDEGMDVPLKSALKTATKGGGRLEATRASSSKRKRSVAKTKVAGTVKYDGSLIDQKVKVWWPDDEMYYEGVVASFDATQKKHKVLYLDGEEEILNLKEEKWEIIQEYSVQYEEKASEVEAQNTDDVPEIPIKKKSKTTSGPSAQRPSGPSMLGMASKSEGDNNGEEGKVRNKPKGVINLKENEKSKEDEQKPVIVKKTSQEPHKIVYKSKGRRNKSKAAEAEPKDDAIVFSEPKSTSEDLKELKDAEAAEEPESVAKKSTGTPKIGSKSGQKRKKT